MLSDLIYWNGEEVIDEVKEQLQTYLNEGGVVIETQRNDKIPVSVYAESTPNPAVMEICGKQTACFT